MEGGSDLFKIINDFILGLGILINAVLAVFTYRKTVNSAKTILMLEKNTNSIKDDLVKITGESERAKGILMGKEQARNEQSQK